MFRPPSGEEDVEVFDADEAIAVDIAQAQGWGLRDWDGLPVPAIDGHLSADLDQPVRQHCAEGCGDAGVVGYATSVSLLSSAVNQACTSQRNPVWILSYDSLGGA